MNSRQSIDFLAEIFPYIFKAKQTLGVPGNADRLVGSMYFLCGRNFAGSI
jgi:hypothetical protein